MINLQAGTYNFFIIRRAALHFFVSNVHFRFFHIIIIYSTYFFIEKTPLPGTKTLYCLAIFSTNPIRSKSQKLNSNTFIISHSGIIFIVLYQSWRNWKRCSGDVECCVTGGCQWNSRERFTKLWSDQLCCMVPLPGQQWEDKKHD